MFALDGNDLERGYRILWNIRDYGMPPYKRDGDTFLIAYMIAEDIIEWEQDALGNHMHLTDSGREWLKDEEEYRNRRRG